ncbi:MAG: tRNA (adenosine(37)-N6)-dimethylallyltransferase MiaA [Alphaproteobacteria bacterium]|nr:tRNA (adenosine(37)-N6)-dimethylallyltransferase MiaA [Alphaproteobacteria bacterium]
MAKQRIILIGGPTASGKSAMAMRIARQTNGMIVNADAMQIYAGLPILTAQPDAADRTEIPHRLYEVMDAAEASSAGKWLTLARAAIAEVWDAGRTPIVVGGTGMYFHALLGGLADIPPIPDAVRAEAQKLYEEWGEEKFRAELAERDAAAAGRIARNDRQRLIRAYEVLAHTGKTLSEWQDASRKRNGIPSPSWGGLGRGARGEIIPIQRHLIMPPREELYAACDKRFASMIERGAIEEVRDLMARNLPPSPGSGPGQALPAMKILGVREIAAHLRSETSLDTAIAKAQQATRNYAKRQVTWFRGRWNTPY